MINNKEYIFSLEILEMLPITYKYMVKDKTKNIGELYANAKYSKSIKHYSNFYLSKDSYKPISNYIKLRKDYE